MTRAALRASLSRGLAAGLVAALAASCTPETVAAATPNEYQTPSTTPQLTDLFLVQPITGTSRQTHSLTQLKTLFGSGGGSTSPGGVTTQLQYNNAGTFGGISGATSDGATLTLVAPILGTPATLVGTNITGTAAGLTAGNVTTDANLTGPILSIGNATSVAAQTGTGSTFVMNTSPVLVTPNLGTPSAAVLTNATGLPLATGVTGTLANANLAALAADSVLGNPTAGSATPTGMGLLSCSTASSALSYNTTSHAFGCNSITGGSATPGGSNTQVQYNNAGAFGGITGATTNGTALTLVAPVLGTPASATLTNATGLPISTGVSGLGTGVATALGIAVSGSGGACLITSCAMTTPAIGAATGASLVLTGSGANILTAGLNGTTNPALNVDASTALSATGVNIKSAAAAGGVAVSVLSSGVNEALKIDAKGSGTITLGGTSTGAIIHTQATTLSAALTYGGVTLANSVQGTGSMVLATSPTLTTPAIGAATGASLVLTGSGANTLAAGLNGSTNPALQVDASTALSATGISIKSAAAAGGVAVAAISSGTNENLKIDAKGSGTLTVNGTATGAITLSRATTLSAALTYGGVTLSNAVTGTGNMVLATTPTLTTPVLGVATGSSLTLQPAADGSAFNVNNTTPTNVLNVTTNATVATSAVNVDNGAALVGYNDTQSTQTWGLTDVTNSGKLILYSAGVAKITLTGSNGTITGLSLFNTPVGDLSASTGAFTTLTASTSILSTGATGGVGYATGAGGAVTQITSRTTGVTLSKATGAITLVSAAGSATWSTFTVTNTAVAATDTIVLSQKSGANLYNCIVTAVAAGSFNISVSAVSGTATEAPVINFTVVKGVAA